MVNRTLIHDDVSSSLDKIYSERFLALKLNDISKSCFINWLFGRFGIRPCASMCLIND